MSLFFYRILFEFNLFAQLIWIVATTKKSKSLSLSRLKLILRIKRHRTIFLNFMCMPFIIIIITIVRIVIINSRMKAYSHKAGKTTSSLYPFTALYIQLIWTKKHNFWKIKGKKSLVQLQMSSKCVDIMRKKISSVIYLNVYTTEKQYNFF